MSATDSYEMAFGEIAENIRETVQPTPADSETYIGLEHLDSGSLRISRWGADVDLKGTKLEMRAGDILFARRNAYLRRVALAPFDGLFSAHGLVLRPKPNAVVPAFLPYFMQSDVFADRAMAVSVGSLSPTINWPTLAEQRFVLPSREKQLRVTNLMAAADDSIDRSEYVDAQLRRLAKSLGEKLMRCDDDCAVSVGALVDRGILEPPQDGNHGNNHPKARDFVDAGVPFLTAGDIRNHQVNLGSAKKLRRKQTDALRIGFAAPGDVLLTHKGTVGEVAILPVLDEPYAMLSPQVTYYRVRDARALNRDFLYYALQAPSFQRQIRQVSQQSTRAYVGITKQRNLLLPFPSPARQVEIASRFREVEDAQEKEVAYRGATGMLKNRIWPEFCDELNVH